MKLVGYKVKGSGEVVVNWKFYGLFKEGSCYMVLVNSCYIRILGLELLDNLIFLEILEI